MPAPGKQSTGKLDPVWTRIWHLRASIQAAARIDRARVRALVRVVSDALPSTSDRELENVDADREVGDGLVVDFDRIRQTDLLAALAARGHCRLCFDRHSVSRSAHVPNVPS
jgi:hypothetical protein